MRNQKVIAWVLFLVFYLNFAGSLYASLSGKEYRHDFNKIINNVISKRNSRFSKKLLATGINAETVNCKDDKNYSGGPSQPEMASFKSVNSDNLVNTFTGDFSYNIPLLDVGGYPVNLFYSGGITMEQEASWVGLGWNINPGTITRNMRGLPDDFDGTDAITKTQHIKPDDTYGVSASLSGEVFGMGPDIGFNGGLFYNNNKGFGIEAGGNAGITLGLSKKSKDENTSFTPSLSLGIGLNLNSQEGLSVQPSMGIHLNSADKSDKYGLQVGTSYNSRSGISGLNIDAEVGKFNKVTNMSYPGSSFSYPMNTSISFAKPSYVPGIRMPLTHSNTSFEFKTGGEFFGLHGNVSIKGYLSRGQIKPDDVTQVKPAVGYLHLEKGNDNKSALLDFNRINDGVYTQTTPLISIPFYTYDVFSISGEGTGGSFRAYRGNIGFARDPYTRTKTENNSFGFELGSGNAFHGGVEYNYVNTPTTVYKWSSNNDAESALKFQASKAEKEGVYFKNPGEKAIVSKDYYEAIGGDNIARLSLLNNGSNQPVALPALDIFDNTRKFSKKLTLTAENTIRKSRDKRTQVISYLNAEEAERIGFDKKIKVYPLNDFSLVASCNTEETPVNTIKRVTETESLGDIDGNYRRKNHISEIDVLEQDGKRYIYGIPVYNTLQKEVSFSVEKPNTVRQDGLVIYSGTENSTDNSSGKDHFYQSETTPAYAHSFLLTSLLSPDYVDVTGNGISDDDLGDAIKFNYSRFGFDGTKWNNYKWRTPFKASESNIAVYNEGLKTDKKDDKGSYTFGEREMWYWHSVESKNLIAVFRLGNRSDNKQPEDADGNSSSDAALKKLDRIDLYSKAAYIKYLKLVQTISNTRQPKPIKSVLFEYFTETEKDKQLCIGTPLNSDVTQGKLTLKSVCFTYNGNDNQKKNIYRFGYINNKLYKRNSLDRWGNYKDASGNPGGLSNADFPYNLQLNAPFNNAVTKEVIDNNAAAWSLNKILLPSGSQLNISYEADDYAFVQNKRAAQMFKITGFADDPSHTPKTYLNESVISVLPHDYIADDYKYVFIEIPKVPASSLTVAEKKQIIFRDYLEGITQLAFKVLVRMPADYQNDAGDEPLSVYANVDFSDPANYGLTADNKVWVKVKEVGNHASPMMATAIQFMKDNLPSKAYPGSNVDPEANGVLQFVRTMVGMMSSIGEAFTGIETKARLAKMCSKVNLDKSFVRLNNPYYAKLGGGYRVKEIRISDNWNKMTNGFDSEYGQHYDYTTTITVDGEKKTISSGVATYEPTIGAEENPFKSVLNYDSKLPMGPTQYGFIDMPFGETFFPSPMVGYSKVRVKSIHRGTPAKGIKSGLGIQETQYYTSKDFPSFADFTDFDRNSNVRYTPDPILKFLKIDVQEMVTLSQGFRVVLNDMNGKIKSQSSYPESDDANPINYTEYFYKLEKKGDNSFTLKNSVAVAGKDGLVTELEVGKDIEMMADFREHRTETTSGGVQFNTDGFMIGPWPVFIPIMFKPPMRDITTFRSVSVLKVINQFGIVDSVLQIDKGSMVSTKNLVYDKETGDVLVSRTQNEFNGSVYNLNYPAHWVYSGMEPASRNINVVYNNVLFRNGILETAAVDQSLFESGDEIYVIDSSETAVENTRACIGLGGISTLTKSNEYKIWAVDIAKDDRNTTHRFLFIDKNGTPYNAANARIKIVRSGKRNLLNASVGNITLLNNPVNETTHTIDLANAAVIKTGATEFKDKWKGEDAFYTVTTFEIVPRLAPLHTMSAPVIQAASYGKSRRDHRFASTDEYPYSVFNQNYFEARNYNNGNYNWDAGTNSWVLFDLNGLGTNHKIYSARLSLYAHGATGTSSFSHVPPYQIGHVHGNTNSHEKIYNYNSDLFSIERCLFKWPTSTSVFGSLFGPTDAYTAAVPASTYVTMYNPTQSFCNDCGYSFDGYDNRLNVKSMVQQMISDKFNIYKQYATAVKIGFPFSSVSGNERRVCFNSGLGSPASGAGPSIEIKYYDEAEGYGLLGNPASPPAGQATVPFDHYEYVTRCYSIFDPLHTQMNPYLHGILGNWRTSKSYVFYGDRKQSDPTTATNIKTDGVIKDFTPYWQYQSGSMAAVPGYNWVWNSQVSQVNRKGLEVENFDALMRYNSGLYGYNDNLPVAVTNNARYRETAFDSFEDYDYTEATCTDCSDERKKSLRHLKLGDNASAHISPDESHSGVSSFKVAPGEVFSFTNTVAALPVNNDLIKEEKHNTPDVKIQLNKTPFDDLLVTLKGNGVDGKYYNLGGGDAYIYGGTRQHDQLRLEDDEYRGQNNFPSFINQNRIVAEWEGILQVDKSGIHNFFMQHIDDDGYFDIYTKTGTLLMHMAADWNGNNGLVPDAYASVMLNAGSYNIKAHFHEDWGGASFNVLWTTPGTPANQYDYIPLKNLYTVSDFNASGSEVFTTIYCEKPGDIRPVANAKIDEFSLINKQKMVISAWVKEGGKDCLCSSYDKNIIELAFDNNTATPFAPAGNIIEGWQRYECVFTVPDGASSATINLKNLSSSQPVYFDDIRIHPFNANMKSFVYDPVTLRLTSELDENNYATFYEYDNDGLLVRVKKETKEGIKTIKETRSAVQSKVQTITN